VCSSLKARHNAVNDAAVKRPLGEIRFEKQSNFEAVSTEQEGERVPRSK